VGKALRDLGGCGVPQCHPLPWPTRPRRRSHLSRKPPPPQRQGRLYFWWPRTGLGCASLFFWAPRRGKPDSSWGPWGRQEAVPLRGVEGRLSSCWPGSGHHGPALLEGTRGPGLGQGCKATHSSCHSSSFLEDAEPNAARSPGHPVSLPWSTDPRRQAALCDGGGEGSGQGSPWGTRGTELWEGQTEGCSPHR
jgi:hypothetical protein